MESSNSSSCVELTIPCKPEYVGVARLAILGVASRMRFSYDEVEDVRLAVGEACTTSVDWAERNGKTASRITLRSEVLSEKLIVEVFDEAGKRGDGNRTDDSEPEALGALLITLLVDEVEVSATDSGTLVRMVKYASKQ